MHALSVLHIDDNQFELDSVAEALRRAQDSGFVLVSVRSVEECRAHMKNLTPDVALVDISLSKMGEEGIGLIGELKAAFPDLVVVMRSSFDDARTVQRSVLLGAEDFISKKVADAELALRIRNAHTMAWLKRGGRTHSPTPLPVVGETMGRVARQVSRLLGSAVSALHVTGESGTGKELVADLVEAQVRGVPFVRVNCGSLSPTLLESELFGHAKGAFTGATSERRGFIEEANGGWLFLDEVACLSPAAQVALLRVLEAGEVTRVGESKPRKVHVRVISACNEPLESLVSRGVFRRDLWQRLREVEIELPPLRDRPQEIPALVAHFCSRMEGGPYTVSPEALEVLASYPWREGNVRELRNCLRAMTTLHIGGCLAIPSIPERIWAAVAENVAESVAPGGGGFASAPQNGLGAALAALGAPAHISPTHPISFDAAVRSLFHAYLKLVLANQERVSLRALARMLGMSHHTVQKRLQELLAEGALTSVEVTRFSL